MPGKSIEGRITKFLARLKPGSLRHEGIVEGMRLPESSLPTPEIDGGILQLGSYLNDFDEYFAISMFRYYLALAVQDEYNGYKVINPLYVLEHIESGYKDDAAETATVDGGIQQPGDLLFRRIKAARATKSKDALRLFLTELECNIKRHCSMMRRELAAELEGSGGSTPSSASLGTEQAFNPSSSVTSSIDTEGPETIDSPFEGLMLSSETGSTDGNPATSSAPSSLGDSGGTSSTGTSTRSPSPVSVSDSDDTELHKYSSILHSYANGKGLGLRIVPATTMSLQGWQCKVILGEIERVATAKTKKMAGHIAARWICQHLGIAR